MRAAALALCALVPIALACGDDATAKRSTTPLVVWVLDEGTEPGEEPAALAGADVAFDPTGEGVGVRLERVTDAAGRVVFEAPPDGGHVSVLAREHTLVTALDASASANRARPNTYGKPPEDLVLVVPRLDRTFIGRTVDVRGALTGKADPADLVSLTASATRRLGRALTTEGRYSLRAPRDRGFFLLGRETREQTDGGTVVAIEHVKSFRIEVTPRGTDGVLDVDVGAQLPLVTRTVALRAALPTGMDPASRLFAEVASLDSQVGLGEGVARPAAGGASAEVSLVVADTDLGAERLVTSATWMGSDGSLSRRSELGTEENRATWDGFLAPPVAPEASRRITDPIALDAFPPAADVRVEVYGAGQLVWILRGPPPHGGRLVLPAPFRLAFSADVQVLALRIWAEADVVVLPPHRELHRRVAVSRDVLVRR